MSVITTVGVRVRQIFYRFGRRLRPVRPPAVEDGTGSLYSVAQLVRANRLARPLLVTGPHVGPWGDRLRQSLEESDISFAVWSEASEPPTADDAESLRFHWVGERCDSFIALGGAETIDLVKIAAARAACRTKTIMGMVGYGKVGKRTPPVIAVPMTAGSGPESLAWAYVTDGEGNRFRIEDAALAPAFAVLDPALLSEAPRPVTASCVIEGLCLAVEAYLSRYAGDETRALAAEAVRAFLEAAEPCWNSGGSPLQRGRLFNASLMAGEAASAAGTGYARALAEAAATVTGISFASACAPLLPAVMEKYGIDAVTELAALAAAAGIASEGAKAQRAAALIARIRRLAFRIGLPDALEGVSPDAEEEIADLAAAAANPRCACPVVWTAEDCARVIRGARSKL